MLYFNHNKFDFWKIYDSIKFFYPIGIKKDESKMYVSYPGIKELGMIVVDNIHDQGKFNSVWSDFTVFYRKYFLLHNQNSKKNKYILN